MPSARAAMRPGEPYLINGILLEPHHAHALKIDNTLTYLQTAFNYQRFAEQILQMEQRFAGEVMSHIEFLRDNDGNITASGLRWCAIRQKSDSMKLCRYSAITTSRLITRMFCRLKTASRELFARMSWPLKNISTRMVYLTGNCAAERATS